jgi:hypothetical protein
MRADSGHELDRADGEDRRETKDFLRAEGKGKEIVNARARN